jgi:hypothetical protein
MNFWMHVIMSASVLPAAVAAGLRYKKVGGPYLPFFLLLWLGIIHEAIKLVIVLHRAGHSLLTNVFVLLQALLLTWQFRNWGLFAYHRRLFPVLLAGFIIIWAGTTFWGLHPFGFNSLFIFFSSIALAVMAIAMQSQQIVWNGGALYRNPMFLISLGVVLYFAAEALSEIFWLYSLTTTPAFQQWFADVRSWVNLGTNFIFLIAILWMSRKRQYVLYLK